MDCATLDAVKHIGLIGTPKAIPLLSSPSVNTKREYSFPVEPQNATTVFARRVSKGYYVTMLFATATQSLTRQGLYVCLSIRE